jgi:hypothetical protein
MALLVILHRKIPTNSDVFLQADYENPFSINIQKAYFLLNVRRH